MMMKEDKWKMKTYLLSSYPFLGTFLAYNIGTDYDGVDLLDNCDFLDKYKLNYVELTFWKMIYNLHR